MKIDEIKLKRIVEILYKRELLGINLMEHINEYPDINNLCNDMVDTALKMEIAVLSKNKDYDILKPMVIEKIKEIHNLCSQIPMYRKSLLFFDNNLDFIDSF